MATLTETAYYTKKFINYSFLGLIILIFSKSIFSFGRGLWRRFNPPKPPAPEVAFGKLPKIKFPESRFKEEQLVYKLSTTTGGTPNLGDRAKVHFMPINKSNLLALERAKSQARKMGFVEEPRKVTETTYQWQSGEPFLSTLEMDIINTNFTIRKNWQDDQTLFMDKMLPIKEQAITEAKQIFQGWGLLTEGLSEGEAQINYLRYATPNIVSAISLSEADFVRVNLFRQNLDDLPVLPANSQEALVSLLFSGSRSNGKRVLEVNYTHFPINTEASSTYPLKSSAQAWQELKSGQGFIANLGTAKEEVIIRDISLAYFENNSPQNYLQPIYVFQGSGDFTAYVSAISPEWLN